MPETGEPSAAEGVSDGRLDQVEGTIKEKTGEVTDDESLEAEGKAQGAWGDAKDAVDDKVDDAVDKIRDRD